MTEPAPEPETTPCPFEDKKYASCNALADHCDDEVISNLCGKTCKCGKGPLPNWHRR